MDPLSHQKEHFIKAYDQYADAVFRHCLFKVSNRELARDLVQETFTKTWVYLAQGKTVDNLKAFIFRVANNLIIDEYRKTKALSLEEVTSDGKDIGDLSHLEITVSSEASRALRQIEKLEPKYKEVVMLRFVSGLSPKEISRILNVTENVVSVRLNRAVKKLQEFLKL